ncbi:MAG: outer membrane lipoprotein-sorting protein [Bacteroidota bacterium]
MRKFMIMTTVVGCFLLFSAPAAAQTLTAEKILLNVKANFDAVKDYSAQLTGTVNMERLKVPEMKVKIYFKQPNKFKTESKGTSFIPRNILDLNPGDLLTKFDASLMGKEAMDGKEQYKIRLITKPEKGKQVRESFIWVDESRWTITRLEAYPSEGRKIEVLITSTLVDGKYILPEKIFAKFDFEQNTDSLAERIYSPQRIPRKGSAELNYSDYKVNTGLSDEFFEKKKEPKQ